MDNNDKYKQLEKITELKEKGVLTEEEYNKEKATILGEKESSNVSKTEEKKKKTDSNLMPKLVGFVVGTVLLISAIILSSLVRVIFVEGIWVVLGFTVPFVTAVFSFAPSGIVLYIFVKDLKKDKKERDTKANTKRNAKLSAIYILLIIVLSVLSTSVFGGLEQTSGSMSESDLRAGYVEGCIYGGDTRKHCECMFEKVIDRYGVDGFMEINDLVKNMPTDKKEAEAYITNLTRTNKDFRDYATAVQGMSASCD